MSAFKKEWKKASKGSLKTYARAQAASGNALAKGWLQRKKKPPVAGNNKMAGTAQRRPERKTFDMSVTPGKKSEG
jgi:hypothetical protein